MQPGLCIDLAQLPDAGQLGPGAEDIPGQLDGIAETHGLGKNPVAHEPRSSAATPGCHPGGVGFRGRLLAAGFDYQMPGCHHRRALRHRVDVFQTLVEKIDPEEPGGAKGLDAGLDFLQMPAQRAFAVVDAEQRLRDLGPGGIGSALLLQAAQQLGVQGKFHGLLPDPEGFWNARAVERFGEGRRVIHAGRRRQGLKALAALQVQER